eukprot:TRINITY_DN12984_c0_g1_i1.p1 TRINITY_DN12984_c0_g1~~TRINITY_DN12984_c0_g1_i1.p1  ORF type:complete len:304 (+),score=46.91 TRINITY_DN12984_c0_g1_i1:201-1112(+)
MSIRASLQGPQQMGTHHRAKWLIRVTDANGGPGKINPDQWNVTISGPSSHNPKIALAEPGSYSFELSPTAVGHYTIDVFRLGKRVFTEPLEVLSNYVESQALGNPYLSSTEDVVLSMEGKGLEIGGKINEPISFTIYSRFSSGKPANISPGDITVWVRGPSEIQANVSGGGAVYVAEYKASRSGKYTVKVYLNGKEIKSSHVVVTGKASINSRIEGQMRTSTGPYSFDIIGIDENGLHLVSGNENFSVAITGNEDSFTQPTIKDHKNGKFTVQLNLKDSGAAYEFHVMLNDIPLSNSPLVVHT